MEENGLLQRSTAVPVRSDMENCYDASACAAPPPYLLRRAFRQLLRPVHRLLLKTLRVEDPWVRYRQAVPLARFGLGARRCFSWYFEGESTVEVRTLDEVREWLLGCEYVRDCELFQERDFWQHPLTFEQLRKGDCEDFALWAWRKLVRLGYDVEFVAGRCILPACASVGHTWLVLRGRSEPLLFDPTLCDSASMLAPLADVQQAYLPEVSVDGHLNRYVYGAYYMQKIVQE